MARSRSKTRKPQRGLIRGVLRVSSAGYGFVDTAEGEYFVPRSHINYAFDGDVVELAPLPRQRKDKGDTSSSSSKNKKPYGRVVHVTERAHDTLIGRYEIAEPFGIVVPYDKRIPFDIFTMRSENLDIPEGATVRVRISEYPNKRKAAMGVIEEIIAKYDSEDLPIEIIIARHKLETEFSEEALDQASQLKLDIEGALDEGYRDIRDRLIFTIDPEDARDFDDALSFEKLKDGFRLGVHIADVSRYVEWGSPIDKEASSRATSVYLVDRVIPMLPERLSNDLCSLKPHESRAALTIDMYLNERADLERVDMYGSLIRSSHRFNYDEVQAALEQQKAFIPWVGDPDEASRKKNFHPQDDKAWRECLNCAESFLALSETAQKLAMKREKAGGMDFDTKEAKVRLDDEGAPLEVVMRYRTEATAIVEEAMILANTAVATHLAEHGLPSLYRVHEAPSIESLTSLLPILYEFNYFSDISKDEFLAGDPHALQEILDVSKGRPEHELISNLLLRSMKRACYSEALERHFGLALETYTHFTSPIRRYPDLVVHRILHAHLRVHTKKLKAQTARLPEIADHSSKMERVAEAAARESQEYKLIELLSHEIGSIFDGYISGVFSYGFFVRLENTAEGLVSIRNLGGEYFSFDPSRYILEGEESGKVYRLGQRLSIMIEAANPRLGRLDFRLV